MRWDSLPYLLLIVAIVMLLLMIHIQTSLHAEPSSKELVLSKVPREGIGKEQVQQQQWQQRLPEITMDVHEKNGVNTLSPSLAPTASPVASSSAISVSVEVTKNSLRWLVISIPTVARRNNENYLLQVSRQSNYFSFPPTTSLR